MAVNEREADIAACTTFIKWMRDAFNTSSTNKELRKSVTDFSNSFARIIQSYEEELECLKSALPADNIIQINLRDSTAESAEE